MFDTAYEFGNVKIKPLKDPNSGKDLDIRRQYASNWVNYAEEIFMDASRNRDRTEKPYRYTIFV